jgi:hypothetical protein
MKTKNVNIMYVGRRKEKKTTRGPMIEIGALLACCVFCFFHNSMV